MTSRYAFECEEIGVLPHISPIILESPISTHHNVGRGCVFYSIRISMSDGDTCKRFLHGVCQSWKFPSLLDMSVSSTVAVCFNVGHTHSEETL